MCVEEGEQTSVCRWWAGGRAEDSSLETCFCRFAHWAVKGGELTVTIFSQTGRRVGFSYVAHVSFRI